MLQKDFNLRQPGIDPGSNAWKTKLLAFTPPTPSLYFTSHNDEIGYFK